MVDIFSSQHAGENALAVNPATTGVLVVDMLNDFCSSGGAMVLPGAADLYDAQNILINAAREAGGVIAFINDCHRPEMRRDREFLKREPHCIEGTWGSKVVDALDWRSGDLNIQKRRFSGFFGTDLDLSLKDMEIDTVVVIGVVTNICVRSTVHDAFFNGYNVIVPEDCVAATGIREQASTLYDISTHFGWVSSSIETVDAISKKALIRNRNTAE